MTKQTAKRFVSVVLLFHLSLIALYPNALSRLQSDLLPAFLPYANLFGLNSKWEFFAPDPEPASYIEYQIDLKTGGEPTTFQYPPAKKGFFDFTYLRRSTSRAYMTIDKTTLATIFIPWVCRTHPEAAGVSVWQVYVLMPTPEQVRNGEPMFDSTKTHSEEATTLSCEEALHGS